jgi:hypothetical protein
MVTFIESRLQHLYEKEQMPTSYNEEKLKSEMKYALLIENINPDLSNLLNEYVDIKTNREVISNAFFYEEGFRDAFKAILELAIK